MANVSQGVAFAWGTVTFGEVVTVNVDGIASGYVEVTPRGQLSRWQTFSPTDVDLGTVSITARGTGGMSAASVGLTNTLSISGPGVSFSFPKAIYEKLGWSAQVGELQVFNVSFKVSN